MLLNILELAINNALEYDSRAQMDLAKVEGKILTLEIRPIPQRISITPLVEGLEFSTESDKCDVHLSATLGALIKIGRDGLEDAELAAGELEISGDPIVGQRFARIISQLDIDWESLLAEHLGQAPAVFISSGLVKAKEFAQGSKIVFSQHLSKLLIDELRIVAEKIDVDPFLDDVDSLRADADRLQARIKRIQKNF